MPRDVNGLYTLPAGNPVVTNTVVSSTWANTTLSDLSTAMSNSLDRTGTASGMTGQFKALSGTVGTPGISFGAETTMGIYRAGAGDMRFAVGGIDVLRFNTTSILAANGAIGTPSYAWASETNSGLYRAAAGDFRFSIAGVDVLKIVAASLSAPSFIPTAGTVPSNGLYLPAANGIGLATNTTLRGSVNSAGNWTFAVPGSGTSITINVLDAVAGAVIFDSPTAVSGYRLQFQQVGAVKGFLGLGSNVITGAAVGDFCISANGGVFRFSSTGATTHVAITAAGILQAVDQAGTLQDVGWRDLPQNAQAGNYTTVMADRGKSLVYTGAGVATFTIDSNANVAYPLGTVLTFANRGGGNLSIAIASDVLILAGTSTVGTRTLTSSNGTASALKTSATVWIISGSGLT